MDRASIFSDNKVIERLKTEFIPFSGNCAELQFGGSPASNFFLKMAKQVNPRIEKRETSQGFYLCTADGSPYSFWNSRDIGNLNAKLDETLKSFKASPPVKVEISEADLNAGYTKTPPADASIVRIFSRIKPLPPGVHELNKGIGRDHLWILSTEVRDIITAGAEQGKAFDFPPTLVQRLVRFHLIDNVRGEPDMWKPEQIKEAKFSAQLVKTEEGRKAYTFTGSFAQELADSSRGQNGTIHGSFEIDVGKKKIVRFRAYSEGQAWGASKYTGNEPLGKFPLVIAMVETDDELSKVIPPQAIWHDGYLPGPKLR